MTSGGGPADWWIWDALTVLAALGGLVLGIYNFFRARREPGRRIQEAHRKKLREELVEATQEIQKFSYSVIDGAGPRAYTTPALQMINSWSEDSLKPPVDDVEISTKINELVRACSGIFLESTFVTSSKRTMNAEERPSGVTKRYVQAATQMEKSKEEIRAANREAQRLITEIIKRIDELDKRP